MSLPRADSLSDTARFSAVTNQHEGSMQHPNERLFSFKGSNAVHLRLFRIPSKTECPSGSPTPALSCTRKQAEVVGSCTRPPSLRP